MQSKTKGIVIGETPFKESSKILNILTEDYGLIGVISKGCRNVKSKLRGVSNKMNYAEYTLNYKENGLSTLIEGDNLSSFKNNYIDMHRAVYSFFVMDLVNQVLKENNSKEIFPILRDALLGIDKGLSPELVSDIVELKLLPFLGVSLNLGSCSVCGREDNLLTLDMTSGGMICRDCYEEGYLFHQETLHLIKVMNEVDLGKIKSLEVTNDAIFKEMDDFLHEYYVNYTGIYLKKKENLLKL